MTLDKCRVKNGSTITHSPFTALQLHAVPKPTHTYLATLHVCVNQPQVLRFQP